MADETDRKINEQMKEFARKATSGNDLDLDAKHAEAAAELERLGRDEKVGHGVARPKQ